MNKALLITLLLLSACEYKAPKITMPTFIMPEFKEKMTCDKKDSEMVFSDEAIKNKIVIEDTIENKQRIFYGCDGKETKRDIGPVRGFEKKISVNLPKNIKDLERITTTNERTCTSNNSYFERKGYDQLPISYFDKNKFHMALTDPNLVVLFQENVKEGNNLFKIQYSKCTKTGVDFKNRPNCLEFGEIMTQEILVVVKIHRPHAEGIHEVRLSTDMCKALEKKQ